MPRRYCSPETLALFQSALSRRHGEEIKLTCPDRGSAVRLRQILNTERRAIKAVNHALYDQLSQITLSLQEEIADNLPENNSPEDNSPVSVVFLNTASAINQLLGEIGVELSPETIAQADQINAQLRQSEQTLNPPIDQTIPRQSPPSSPPPTEEEITNESLRDFVLARAGMKK